MPAAVHAAQRPQNPRKSVVQLYRDKTQKYNGFKKQKKVRAKPAWVDVSDEESRNNTEKNPLKRNGAMANGQEQQSPRRKKPRHASHSHQANGIREDATNGAGPSTLSPKAAAIQEQRRDLPIAQGREALIEEIRRNDVTVLLGETGSGKTTRKSSVLPFCVSSFLSRPQRFHNTSWNQVLSEAA